MSPLPPLVLTGNCLDELKRIPDASVAAVVTDPPYGLSNTDPAHVVEALTHWANGDRDFIPSGRGFMGKEWDAFVPPPAVWDECMRILKPGGHLLAFAGSRTFDLMTLSIRFAGFDIRDSIAWLYGSGFPKSMDVALAIDKAQGHERERQEPQRRARTSAAIRDSGFGANGWSPAVRDAGTADAKRWQGWGTALKPAFEPIVVARKPFPGTVAANVLEHGTGALNIDATRIATDDKLGGGHSSSGQQMRDGWERPWMSDPAAVAANAERSRASVAKSEELGRWPANVILDEDQAAALDEQTGSETSRFFYVAKAPKSERPVVDGVAHPTVKPLALMRWLIRLVTPAGECVVDPFAGSGTTLEAAYLEGMESIGVEMTADYLPLIQARIDRVVNA